MGPWNWLDWLLVAIVLVSVITAVQKGFVAELISVAALVAGTIVAALTYHRIGAWFEGYLKSHEIALAVGFLVPFVGVVLIGALVSALARKLVKTAGIQWFDRFLGAIFGFIRGVAMDCVLLMVLVAFGIKTAAVESSQLAPYITTGARVIAVVMPSDLKAQFHSGFEKFKQAVVRANKSASKD